MKPIALYRSLYFVICFFVNFGLLAMNSLASSERLELEKSTVSKDCSFDGIVCLAGVLNYSRHNPPEYNLEDIYIFERELVLNKGTVEHKKSLLQMDSFLQKKEKLDFGTMTFRQRQDAISKITKNFRNECRESACVAVGEIPNIAFPKADQVRAVYVLEGQDTVAGPSVFVFASQGNKRMLLRGKVKTLGKRTCTALTQPNCDLCSAEDEKMEGIISCRQSKLIQERVKERATELVQNLLNIKN